MTTPKPSQLNLRLPPALLAEWRDVWAQTFPAHRLGFPAWIISRVLLGLQKARDGDASPHKKGAG